MLRLLLKSLEIFVIAGIAIFFCLPAQASSFMSCYNGPTNRIYFQALDTKKSNRCHSSLYYQGQKDYFLIENSKADGPFPINNTGSQTLMQLENGRQLLITQWQNFTDNNKIVVLEPRLNSGKLFRHCEVSNAGTAYNVRFSKKSNKLYLQVLQKRAGSPSGQATWKACNISS